MGYFLTACNVGGGFSLRATINNPFAYVSMVASTVCPFIARVDLVCLCAKVEDSPKHIQEEQCRNRRQVIRRLSSSPHCRGVNAQQYYTTLVVNLPDGRNVARHKKILQLGLHVQVGRRLDEVGRDVKEGFRLESARGSEVSYVGGMHAYQGLLNCCGARVYLRVDEASKWRFSCAFVWQIYAQRREYVPPLARNHGS